MIFFSGFELSYLFLPLIGLIVGFMSSSMGSGGGLFFPVILILVYGIPPHIAVASSLAAGLPISIAGSAAHYRKGTINLRIAYRFGVAGIIGALVGVATISLLDSGALKIMFGIYSFLLAILIWHKKGKESLKEVKGSRTNKIYRNPKVKAVIFGFAGGFISGVFGTSGAAPVFAGLLILGIPFLKAIGTSMLVVLLNTLSALAGHFVVGKIDLSIVLMLSAGSVAGAVAGPHFLVKTYRDHWEKSLRRLFSFIIAAIGIIMIISALTNS